VGDDPSSAYTREEMNQDTSIHQMTTPQLQGVLTALSVECAAGLWRATGLSLHEGEEKSVLTSARDLLHELEGESDSPYQADYSEARSKFLAESFYNRLSTSGGPDLARRIFEWAHVLVQNDENADWYLGVMACFELLNDPLKGHGKLALEKNERELLLRIVADRLRNDVDVSLTQACKTPASAYDTRLFARMSPGGTPVSALHLLLLRHRYDELLARVRSQLSQRGAKAFVSWLQGRIKQLKFEAKPPNA
jgi:hypothetical protein